jgi:hypothetical protein
LKTVAVRKRLHRVGSFFTGFAQPFAQPISVLYIVFSTVCHTGSTFPQALLLLLDHDM